MVTGGENTLSKQTGWTLVFYILWYLKRLPDLMGRQVIALQSFARLNMGGE